MDQGPSHAASRESNQQNSLLHVAIIGAGPAGYYTAEALARKAENVRVDILDRLPTPYGLIRAGVAPDHQSIKNVAKRYEKTNIQDNVRFVGNLDIGKDISLEQLMSLYDAIVLATGAARDRDLGIPGEDLKGVIGSAKFVGWYNSHPDFKDLNPDMSVAAATVIGAGNVALDVGRILAKTRQEMAESDIADYASQSIEQNPLRDIYIIARRGPLDAKFTPKELGEMGRLDRYTSHIHHQDLPEPDDLADLPSVTKKNLNILRSFTTDIDRQDQSCKSFRIHFKFWRKPVAIIGEGRVCGIELEKTAMADGKLVGTGTSEILPVGLIVPCIGYRTIPVENVPYDENYGHFFNQDSHIRDNLFCAGWARRGPTGTIGTNKPDGNEVADKILSMIQPGGKAGRAGLDQYIDNNGLSVTTFRDWKKIEAAEAAAATDSAPRRKFSDVDEMLSIARHRKPAITEPEPQS